MKKNPQQKNYSLEVDPLTGDFLLRIPEWALLELSWDEDTELEINVDSEELTLRQKLND